MIEIDGGTGEAGGQIIRTSLTLSALTNKPVKIFNIRKNRPKPGLAMQHLTGAKAVRSICRGELIGAELGSTELIFNPGKIVGGNYEFNIGTAGSTILVAQTIIPLLLHAEKKSTIKIIGGTHVIHSPSYDYFSNVFLKALECMGGKVSSKLISSGYYPEGGGAIEITIEPSKLSEIAFFPEKNNIEAIIRLGSLPTHIGVREKKILVQNGIEKIRFIEEKTLSQGNCVTLHSGLIGFSVVGEKGKRAETVAQEAVSEFTKQLTYDVDYWLADQLMIYYSLIKKGSYSFLKATNHLKTNSEIIKKFLDVKISIKDDSISFT
ncbi:MAG: RNA 3'-terminal phosphate cyclase [Candidatus ainarchaeum sp.]|nr:RNA 3'-terminal phosphate cyclase [Candidatus ainarchaeum sp.]